MSGSNLVKKGDIRNGDVLLLA